MDGVSSSKYVAMLFCIEFVAVKSNLFSLLVSSAALLLHREGLLGRPSFNFHLLK